MIEYFFHHGGRSHGDSRITIFAGHYGSGKTTLALNYAFWLKQRHQRVALCDLDIVNPYFRTADAARALQAAGIALISSTFANTNVEAPALPPEAKSVFDDHGVHAVIDLGGDDRGALALGRYARLLREEADCQMLLVINQYRPLTRSLPDLSLIRAEIEAAGKVPFTGIANNSNLGGETTLSDIHASLPFAEEASQALGLPLRMTAVSRRLLPKEGSDGGQQDFNMGGSIFPVDIYGKSIWTI